MGAALGDFCAAYAPKVAQRLRNRSIGAYGFDDWPKFIPQSCSTRCYTTVMSKTITQRELRNESGEIMRLLDQGETFIVTRNGVPVGELAPLRRNRFVTADAAIAMFRNAPRIDAERFRADLDAIADQDSDPRA